MATKRVTPNPYKAGFKRKANARKEHINDAGINLTSIKSLNPNKKRNPKNGGMTSVATKRSAGNASTRRNTKKNYTSY